MCGHVLTLLDILQNLWCVCLSVYVCVYVYERVCVWACADLAGHPAEFEVCVCICVCKCVCGHVLALLDILQNLSFVCLSVYVCVCV